MRFEEMVVHDMWKLGEKILLVVDTQYIPGLVFEYKGKNDFYGLKSKIKFGEKFIAARSRDYQYMSLKEEATFEICA